jgi:hypothetical protein
MKDTGRGKVCVPDFRAGFHRSLQHTADVNRRYAWPEYREQIGPAEVEYLGLGQPDYRESTRAKSASRLLGLAAIEPVKRLMHCGDIFPKLSEGIQ